MEFAAAEAIIKARFIAEWPNASVPIWWTNEENTLPDKPAPFLAVEIIGDGEAMYAHGAGRGANVWRGVGAIGIHVLVPKGWGTQPALQYLDDAFAIFRGLRLDGVSYEAGIPQGAGQYAHDGTYWQVDGEVPFHTYLIG